MPDKLLLNYYVLRHHKPDIQYTFFRAVFFILPKKHAIVLFLFLSVDSSTAIEIKSVSKRLMVVCHTKFMDIRFLFHVSRKHKRIACRKNLNLQKTFRSTFIVKTVSAVNLNPRLKYIRIYIGCVY